MLSHKQIVSPDAAGGHEVHQGEVAGAGDAGSSGAPAPATALYNMAVAGVAENITLGLLTGSKVPAGVKLDKLRLFTWAKTGFDPVAWASRVIGGVNHWHASKGRKRGREDTTIWRGWWGAGSAKMETAVMFQYHVETGKFVVEFNPAKQLPVLVEALGMSMAAVSSFSIADWFVERYDAAFDYGLHRGLMVLDDPLGAYDLFNVRIWGPETERTRYRKGSKMKYQLYDKTAERREHGQELGEWVSRFEIQHWPIPGQGEYRLRDLGEARYPGGDVVPRVFAFDVGAIRDPLMQLAGWAVRGGGPRVVRALLHDLVSKRRCDDFFESVLPTVDPMPSRVWSSGWASAVAGVVGALMRGASQAAALVAS